MNASLQRMCEQFIVNRDRVKAAFRWDSSLLYPACANLFCAAGREADVEKMTKSRQQIKAGTGLLSNFRGNVMPALACMMSMAEDPDRKLARTLENYQMLKQEFAGSEYLALVSAFLTELTEEKAAEDFAGRGKTLYRRMKKEHPFLTSQEDSVFAVLMAASEKSDDQLVEDMESCYQLLRGRFHSANAVQTASHVLALGDSVPKEKADRVIGLYDAIVQAGGKYGREYELAILAALAVQEGDVNVLASEIMDADAFLAAQKGYGFFGPGRRARAMHAAMIVSDVHGPKKEMGPASMTTALAAIAAQQTAACAAVMSATAAASASSGS